MRYAKGCLVISPTTDIPLLRQVRNSRFISGRQLFELLRHDVFISQAFFWRVRRLLGAGYIRILPGTGWQGSPIYTIAPRGLLELESQGDFAIALHSRTRHMPNPVQVYHALELNEIRLALARNSLLAGWQSEVEIASTNMVSSAPYQKDYDAVIRIWTGNQVRELALEYERSLKAARQYARIRAALECERQVDCVLYLTASPDLMLALIYQLTPLTKPVAFATARSFRQHLLATSVMTDATSGLRTLDNFLAHASPRPSA